MEIINRAVAELIPYENNPRINDKAVYPVAESIRHFGFKVPIVVDKDGVIIAGHTRAKAAKKLGLESVPVIIADDLTDEQVTAFRLADNKVAELADWDADKLLEEIAKSPEIDYAQFGFNLEEFADSILDEEEELDELEKQKREFEERMKSGELSEDSEEYQEFLKKFEDKKTTDDCYTPAIIYEALADYVAKRYNLNRLNFVRPFVPGGDYEAFEYSKSAVVVDNPPFSILSQIISFYQEHKIPFFLFGPSVSCFSAAKKCTAICTGCTVTYENGARVHTSFMTNLEPEDVVFKSDPELYKVITEADTENLKNITKQLPKYQYPMELITASQCAMFSKYGIEFEGKKHEVFRVAELDAQKKSGKGIFGSGYLMGAHLTEERILQRSASKRSASNEKSSNFQTENERLWRA